MVRSRMVWSSESASRTTSLGLPPLDNEYESINETLDHLDVHDRHDWRNLNYNIIVVFARSNQQLFHPTRAE